MVVERVLGEVYSPKILPSKVRFSVKLELRPFVWKAFQLLEKRCGFLKFYGLKSASPVWSRQFGFFGLIPFDMLEVSTST